MFRAGAGFSTHLAARHAAREASEQALGAAGGADVALLFAGPAHRSHARELLSEASAVLGTTRVVGSLAHGVLGAGLEQEGGACVSVLAVRGLEAHPLWCADLTGHEEHVADEVAHCLGGDPRPEDLVVLVPDPRALRPDVLLEAVADVLGPATLVGAGAGDPVSEAPLVWCDGQMAEGAMAGLVLRGARALRVGVAQACRPATPLYTVTRSQGPWVQELDGRPALDVYREAAGLPLADDLRRAAAFVLAALPEDPEAPLEPGSYRVRNVAGFAPEQGAFAVAEPVAKGDPLALVHREPETARADLKALLERLGSEPAAAALYFDCCARGQALFGVPGLESAYIAHALGDTPVVGMFGSCELGPIGGRPELLTYTGVLALLDS